MTARLRICLLALSSIAGAAQAQTQLPLQPGLWEETIATRRDGANADPAMARMQERLAAMPPDQRKKVEQMMAAKGVAMGPGGNTVRVCLTKERIAHDFVPDGGDGNCTHKRVSQSGNTTTFSFTCQGRRSVSGQGVFTLNDAKSFAVTSDADIVAQASVPASHLHTDVTGRFVSADCGSLQPTSPSAH